MKSLYFNGISLSLILLLGITPPVYGQESEHEHHDETETKHDLIQHRSHEHGDARLTLAKTDTGIEVVLETPAVNLFGFEHQAHDKQEQHAVQTVITKLKAGEALLIANPDANCKLEKVDIESDLIPHDEEKKEDAEEETHSDVDVSWQFNCKNLQALESVKIKLFSQFPKGFEHLNVEWITHNNAGAVVLQADGMVKLGQ